MIRRFGDSPRPDVAYRLRPGAHAILPHRGRLLVTHQADPLPELQLPGGGIDPGESPVQAGSSPGPGGWGHFAGLPICLNTTYGQKSSVLSTVPIPCDAWAHPASRGTARSGSHRTRQHRNLAIPATGISSAGKSAAFEFQQYP